MDITVSTHSTRFVQGAILFTRKKQDIEPDVGRFHLRLVGAKLPAGARPVALLNSEGHLEILDPLEVPTPEEVTMVRSWLVATTQEEIRRFLGSLTSLGDVMPSTSRRESVNAVLQDLVSSTHVSILRLAAEKFVNKDPLGFLEVRKHEELADIKDLAATVGYWVSDRISERDRAFFAQNVPDWASLWMARLDPEGHQAAMAAYVF